jgi:hypothetical protein
VAFTAKGYNFYEIKSGGLYEKYIVVTSTFGTIAEFA